MKTKPPIELFHKPQNLKRYIGRVAEVIRNSNDTVLAMNIWEFFGNRRGFGKQYFVRPCINKIKNGLATKSGERATVGSVVELWAWQEKRNGLSYEHLHVEVL